VEANTNENVIETGIVSRGIYFIFKGHVSIFYKNSSELAKLGSGSYFGDISYIFNLKN
jgi:signal-transduction protein with cAMP-binding, CBS, and nucleotidyltransferase domain